MEIEIQIRAIDENTCKHVFENMIKAVKCVPENWGGVGHFQHKLYNEKFF